jgi:alpha-ketoglutarate-dependent taurine dioxygenase
MAAALGDSASFGTADIQLQLDRVGYAYVPTVPRGFDYLRELSRLGPPVPQYGGALVRDVKPDPAISNDVVSAANTAELTPHTEWYEFPGLPPRYVALWCQRPAAGPGGETTFADGYLLLRQFTVAERERMSSDLRIWRSRPTLTREGVDQLVRQPILASHAGRTVLRFSTLDLQPDDSLTERYIAAGREFFEAARTAIKIPRGGLLVWDNWRMLHARTAFNDPRRHLRRVLIAAHA